MPKFAAKLRAEKDVTAHPDSLSGMLRIARAMAQNLSNSR